jgi:NlpC/P60 family putative phage cell wall peptidase
MLLIHPTGSPPGPPAEQVVALARVWLGTPYHHQASVRGVGVDCLGLLRGVWRDLYGREPEALPDYARGVAELAAGEPLLAAARRHLLGVAARDMRPGDVLLFRWQRTTPVKHVGILTTPTTLLHAVEGRTVAEEPFAPCWRRRLAAAFRFPPATSL